MTDNKVVDPISSATIWQLMGLWMGNGNQKYQATLTVQFSVTPPILPSGAGLIVGIVEIMPIQ